MFPRVIQNGILRYLSPAESKYTSSDWSNIDEVHKFAIDTNDLDWFQQQLYIPTESMWLYAIQLGNLDVLKFAHCQKVDVCSPIFCNAAASNGQLEILIWMEKNGCMLDFHICNAAALGGHLSILKWLYNIGYVTMNESTCHAAARGGQIKVLEWLFKIRRGWVTTDTCNAAALDGHLDILKYLHMHGFCSSSSTCSIES